MSTIHNISYSLLICVAFCLSIIARFTESIDLGDFLILLMLEIGFLAIINKEEKSCQ